MTTGEIVVWIGIVNGISVFCAGAMVDNLNHVSNTTWTRGAGRVAIFGLLVFSGSILLGLAIDHVRFM